MGVWGCDLYIVGKVCMMVDGSVVFIYVLGLMQDLFVCGMGICFLCYVMVIDGGVVKMLVVEVLGKFEVSDVVSVFVMLMF